MISTRIIHLITTIERGGAEKQLLTLVREQIKTGLNVEVYYLKGNPDLKQQFENHGVKVNQSLLDKSFINQILIFRSELRKNLVPVHAHLPQSELLAAFVCKKRNFIFTRHNSEAFWPGAPKLISNFLSKFVAKRAAGGVCISNAVKNFLLTRGELDKQYPLTTVYYGFDEDNSLNQAGLNEIKNGLKLSSQALKIGAIGRLVEQKEYPTLLKALKIILDDGINAELFVVGEGVLKEDLVNLTQKLDLSQKVHWLGKTGFIKEYLSILDIFVLPSKYEGFGLVLLEAMQANIPIIAANNSSIPEVLGPNYKGLFNTFNVEQLSSLITKVIVDKTFTDQLVLRNQERLILFKPDVMTKQILGIYKEARF